LRAGPADLRHAEPATLQAARELSRGEHHTRPGVGDPPAKDLARSAVDLDAKRAAGQEHPEGLPEIALRVRLAREMLENDVREDEIELAVGKKVEAAVGRAELDVPQFSAVVPSAAKHLVGEVDADDPRDAAGERSDEPTHSAADLENAPFRQDLEAVQDVLV